MLSEYMLSIPWFYKVPIGKWIEDIERSDEQIEIPDVQTYFTDHLEKMPQGEGFEKGSLNPFIIDPDSSEEGVKKEEKKGKKQKEDDKLE